MIDPESLPTDAITYQLVIRLLQPCRVTPGRLGSHDLAAGLYIYTGSARRNMHARIQRHLRRDKPMRWHIDWLLSRPEAQVIEVATSAERECAVNARTGGDIVIAGFGSSDCRAHCGSHLRRVADAASEEVDPSTVLARALPACKRIGVAAHG